ncbi:MAG: NADP(H)-dependent aldo-keto reductase [Gammaproteobacteria bacterium]|jgi:aryl-alcohol dehydrogenase-like predicted oxidoreductase
MEHRKLGNTDLEVSLICLGTMTYGEQNTQSEAHAQLDYAVEHGINFIDTAEMYPVPPKAETQGRTEAYIGSWLKQRGRRDDLIIASKVAGPGNNIDYLRDGPHLDTRNIEQAVHDSLKRLNTDYLDLYQVHWPERPTNFFGKLGYQHSEENGTPIEETLTALTRMKDAGKIRHIGISNETPWGMMEYLRLAETQDLSRIVSIQNPYSLLNRTFEIGLAEMAHREQVGLLAYSPLAFGRLSGKYQGGQQPPKGRITLFSRFTRYNTPQGVAATDRYVALAGKHGLTPTQLALAFVNSRSFLTSNIIGATSLEQLKEDIDSARVTLSQEILDEIETIHTEFPNPCP